MNFAGDLVHGGGISSMETVEKLEKHAFQLCRVSLQEYPRIPGVGTVQGLRGFTTLRVVA